MHRETNDAAVQLTQATSGLGLPSPFLSKAGETFSSRERSSDIDERAKLDRMLTSKVGGVGTTTPRRSPPGPDLIASSLRGPSLLPRTCEKKDRRPAPRCGKEKKGTQAGHGQLLALTGAAGISALRLFHSSIPLPHRPSAGSLQQRLSPSKR